MNYYSSCSSTSAAGGTRRGGVDGTVTSIEQKRRDWVCVCVCVYVYRVWREEAMKSSKTQSVV